MFPATSQLVPFAVKSCRQIVPPVVATLIAAGLISAYNRTFSAHLQQPRMSTLHEANAADGTSAPITTVGMTKPPAPPAPAVTETITIYEEALAPERLAEKDSEEEAGKDQSAVKAVETTPASASAKTAASRVDPKIEPGVEPHHVASIEPAQPVQPLVRAPVPVIAGAPSPRHCDCTARRRAGYAPSARGPPTSDSPAAPRCGLRSQAARSPRHPHRQASPDNRLRRASRRSRRSRYCRTR